MPDSLVDRLLQAICTASTLYYRLVFLVGPAGSGKTETLRELSARAKAPLVNVNLELARRMLDLTERQRRLIVQRFLDDLVENAVQRDASNAHVEELTSLILLDNIELLFDAHLQHDPLRLLQRMSRDKTVVAAWNGTVIDGFLIYAVPDHPEYRRYEVRDFLTVSMENVA